MRLKKDHLVMGNPYIIYQPFSKYRLQLSGSSSGKTLVDLQGKKKMSP